MTDILKVEYIQLFVIFAFPGFISMQVYRLFVASDAIKWSTAFVEAVFYSIINSILTFPLVFVIFKTGINLSRPYAFWGILILVVLICPCVWPYLLVKLRNSKWVSSKMLHPENLAWDFFFQQKLCVFMIIKLKNGKRIGGLFGEGSYASAYPHEGDLYLQTIYEIDEETGALIKALPYSRGLLIRKEEYSYIELLDIPPQETKGETENE